MSYGRRTADKLITSQLNMNLPHLHARYAEFEASVNLSDGEVCWLELFHANNCVWCKPGLNYIETS